MSTQIPDDLRYDVLDAANDVNRLAEIQAGISFLVGPTPIIAIVDEEEGGIIAYAIQPFANKIVEALNQTTT